MHLFSSETTPATRLPNRSSSNPKTSASSTASCNFSASSTSSGKIFPEEVEEALKLHDAVEDALVFGLDDERFGSRVAGVVSLENKCTAEVEEILDATRKVLASYKLPKELLIVPTVPRAPNGKADYKSAKALLIRA